MPRKRIPAPPDDPFRQKERVIREKGPERQDWMTSAELSAYLGVNPRTLRHMRNDGRVPQPAAHTKSGYGLWSPEQQRTALERRAHLR